MVQSKSIEKIAQFKTLVNLFKEHHFCDHDWINPYQIRDINFENEKIDFETLCEKYKTNQVLNPWNWWFGNLDAEILLIGQDWGSEKSKSSGGLGELINYHNSSGTDDNLRILFEVLFGYDIGKPYSQINAPSEHKLFFTNAILGIRKGDKDTGEINSHVYKETSVFLFSLINIIKPKYIIALGGIAYKAIYHIYNQIDSKKEMPNPNSTLIELIQNNRNPPKIGKAKLFVSYHCSNSNIKRTKYKINSKEIKLSIDVLREDWKEIKKHMKDNKFTANTSNIS